MGCRQSRADDPDAQKDQNITNKLARAEKRDRQVMKLLLLGAGDSGKTTIFKQMRILYGDGFSDEKRANLKIAVFNNLMNGARAVIKASQDGVAGKPLSPEYQDIIDLIFSVKENSELTEEVAQAIATLWKDQNFQATWDERSKFQVLDGWEDFAKQCQNFPTWGGPNWIPSVQDAIQARVRTSGIVEEKFEIDGIDFVLLDVGGQRNERKKWIHCFESVTAVIFVVAISEYDQMMFEVQNKNRLQEALELFENIANSEWFVKTNIVLFLNKSDIFRYKLCDKMVPLNVSGLFPDAPETFEFKDGVAWMKKKFMGQVNNEKKTIFSHVTNATDTYNIQVVFDACKDSILRDSLADLGLIVS